MSARFVLGTVRARRGGRHVVVAADGERMYVVFEGGQAPANGVDVVGRAEERDGTLFMQIVPDLTARIMSGRVNISTYGDGQVTARMLAKVLSVAGPGVVAPGTGGTIDRTTRMTDPDAAWAFDVLGDKARALGIALNVVDPLAAAGREWADAGLVERHLPADATGERDALADMRSIFLSGMSPACRRTMEEGSRGMVPSVDFVIPYSPFLTGSAYSAKVARAYRDEIVRVPLTSAFARRISSYREMCLPFAPRYVGRRRPTQEGVRQIEETFADVAAALAVSREFGEDGRRAAMAYARLREASVARWNGDVLPPLGSHLAINAVLGTVRVGSRSLDDELDIAANAARTYAPGSMRELLSMRASADGDAFMSVGRMTHGQTELLQAAYADDVREASSRIAPSDAAMERFSRFSILHVPLGWEDCFDDAVRPMLPERPPAFLAREGIDLVALGAGPI